MWRRFYSEELNNPDRHDYYIMQLTRYMRGMFGATPSFEAVKVHFGTKAQRVPTPEEAAAWSRINLGLGRKKDGN